MKTTKKNIESLKMKIFLKSMLIIEIRNFEMKAEKENRIYEKLSL